MTGYLASGFVLPLMFSACAADDVGLESEAAKAGTVQPSNMNFELLARDAPVIRGFVAAGSGCRALGNPVVAGNTVTVILVDYVAEQEGPGISRATCDVAVEVDLPPGLSVSLDDVVYRGFSDGSRARSTFFREYFFAGDFIGDRRFTVIDYDAAGAVHMVQNDSDGYTSDFGEFASLDRILSARSGGKFIWRANTALSVRNDSTNSFALASIDTIDAAHRHFVTFRFGSLTSGN